MYLLKPLPEYLEFSWYEVMDNINCDWYLWDAQQGSENYHHQPPYEHQKV